MFQGVPNCSVFSQYVYQFSLCVNFDLLRPKSILSQRVPAFVSVNYRVVDARTMCETFYLVDK